MCKSSSTVQRVDSAGKHCLSTRAHHLSTFSLAPVVHKLYAWWFFACVVVLFVKYSTSTCDCGIDRRRSLIWIRQMHQRSVRANVPQHDCFSERLKMSESAFTLVFFLKVDSVQCIWWWNCARQNVTSDLTNRITSGQQHQLIRHNGNRRRFFSSEIDYTTN